MDFRRGASMDAGQDVWDWEVLPDHMSSSMCHDSTNLADDEETKEPTITPPSSDADVRDEPFEDFRDVGVVVLDETKPSEEATMPMPEVTDASASDGEKKTFQSPDTKKPDEVTNGEEEKKTFQGLGTKEDADDGKLDEEEEQEDDDIKKNNCRARPERVVFGVGKLKVNGVGALCSFGIAAATVCIFLIGGKLQHHRHHRQQQFYSDDKGIQQVVQQTSRLN